MASTYTPIATFTSNGTSNGITFSSIPQTYTDLILVVNYRSQVSAATDGLYLYADNTANGNYSATMLKGDGSSATSTRTTSDFYGAFVGYAPGASTTTGTFGSAIIHIQNYTNTTTFKTALVRTGTAGSYATAAVALLRGTGAITAVSPFVYGGASNLVAGSTATLYGVKAA